MFWYGIILLVLVSLGTYKGIKEKKIETVKGIMVCFCLVIFFQMFGCQSNMDREAKLKKKIEYLEEQNSELEDQCSKMRKKLGIKDELDHIWQY
jgi:hypothetical protein